MIFMMMTSWIHIMSAPESHTLLFPGVNWLVRWRGGGAWEWLAAVYSSVGGGVGSWKMPFSMVPGQETRVWRRRRR